MSTIIYKKDTRFKCNACGDHLFTCNKNIFSGDLFQISQFYENQGQAPFFFGQPLQCKKCKCLLTIKDFSVMEN